MAVELAPQLRSPESIAQLESEALDFDVATLLDPDDPLIAAELAKEFDFDEYSDDSSFEYFYKDGETYSVVTNPSTGEKTLVAISDSLGGEMLQTHGDALQAINDGMSMHEAEPVVLSQDETSVTYIVQVYERTDDHHVKVSSRMETVPKEQVRPTDNATSFEMSDTPKAPEGYGTLVSDFSDFNSPEPLNTAPKKDEPTPTVFGQTPERAVAAAEPKPQPIWWEQITNVKPTPPSTPETPIFEKLIQPDVSTTPEVPPTNEPLGIFETVARPETSSQPESVSEIPASSEKPANAPAAEAPPVPNDSHEVTKQAPEDAPEGGGKQADIEAVAEPAVDSEGPDQEPAQLSEQRDEVSVEAASPEISQPDSEAVPSVDLAPEVVRPETATDTISAESVSESVQTAEPDAAVIVPTRESPVMAETYNEAPVILEATTVPENIAPQEQAAVPESVAAEPTRMETPMEFLAAEQARADTVADPQVAESTRVEIPAEFVAHVALAPEMRRAASKEAVQEHVINIPVEVAPMQIDAIDMSGTKAEAAAQQLTDQLEQFVTTFEPPVQKTTVEAPTVLNMEIKPVEVAQIKAKTRSVEFDAKPLEPVRAEAARQITEPARKQAPAIVKQQKPVDQPVAEIVQPLVSQPAHVEQIFVPESIEAGIESEATSVTYEPVPTESIQANQFEPATSVQTGHIDIQTEMAVAQPTEHIVARTRQAEAAEHHHAYFDLADPQERAGLTDNTQRPQSQIPDSFENRIQHTAPQLAWASLPNDATDVEPEDITISFDSDEAPQRKTRNAAKTRSTTV